MTVLDEIRKKLNWGTLDKGSMISLLPAEYPAWTVIQQDWYGVMVPLDKYVLFSEEFSKARIFTLKDVKIGGISRDVLVLSCDDPNLRNAFASICCQFVDPGENGKQRIELITHPENWWKEWKKLLGNTDSNKNPYPELAELIVLEKLLRKGHQTQWGGLGGSVHDIEYEEGYFEVKSTIKRYGYEVTISSPYQMEHPSVKLDLVFCRFEETEGIAGISINDEVETIVSLGYPREDIEEKLKKKGLEAGKTARNRKYSLIEMKVFPVDENFPVVVPASFVGGVIPTGVKTLKYDVDLSGLECRPEP